MAKCKGTTLIPRLKYIDQKSTPEQKANILKQLPPDFQAEIKKGILPINWYPLNYLIELNTVADKVLGKGDLALVRDMARFSSEEAANGLVKIFLRLGSPEFILKRVMGIWSQYYDTGRMEVTFTGNKQFEMTMIDFDQPEHVHCLLVIAWAQKILELSGGLKVQVECSGCVRKGAPVCRFKGSWE